MATVHEEITDNFEIALTESNRQSRVELQTTPTSARSYFTYGLQRNAAVQIAYEKHDSNSFKPGRRVRVPPPQG
jgi:hypothetical protein